VPEVDPEAEVETDQVSALGQMNSFAGDEESKKNLRAQLRKTLSEKQSTSGESLPVSRLEMSVLICLNRSWL
jgi:vacuolar fusion protein MON1